MHEERVEKEEAINEEREKAEEKIEKERKEAVEHIEEERRAAVEKSNEEKDAGEVAEEVKQRDVVEERAGDTGKSANANPVRYSKVRAAWKNWLGLKVAGQPAATTVAPEVPTATPVVVPAAAAEATASA